MKPLIIIAVVLLHLVGLWFLYISSRPPRPQEHPPSPPENSGSSSETEESPTSSPSPQKRDRQFDPNAYTIVSSSLPQKLQLKASACTTGVLIDWTNRRMLWQKNARKSVAIASMTKMMTALALVEAAESRPDITLNTVVQVTKKAWAIKEGQVYLDPRESFTLDELLKCMMIHSANDAAYLVAEYLGNGDPKLFYRLMNKRAKELGLTTLIFHNASGLPVAGSGKQNSGCAMDLAMLAGRCLEQPAILKWGSTWMSQIREKTGKPFQLVNRNRLVKTCPGVNGMKTGYTRKAGFCVAATCERDKRTLIAVVTGCPNKKRRNDLVPALLDWGYAQPTQ